MIDENETFKRFGYHSYKWSMKSSKPIVAVCDGCGAVREIQKRGYRDLCLKCACNTPERAAMLSRTHKDKVVSAEQKQKQSDKMVGRKATDETREKMSVSHRGYKHTDETKDNISRAQKGRQKTANEIINIARAAKLRPPVTDDTKQKMSEVRKGVLKSDDAKSAMRKPKSEHHKHHISAAQQGISYADWGGNVTDDPMYYKKYNTQHREEHSIRDKRTYYAHKDYILDRNRRYARAHPRDSRDYVLDPCMCIKLNQKFPGSVGHHLTSGVLIYIPEWMNKGTLHNMKTGQGMYDINSQAINYLRGSI